MDNTNNHWPMRILGKMDKIQQITTKMIRDVQNECIAKGAAFDEAVIDKFYDFFEAR